MLVTVLGYVADQATKWWALRSLTPNQRTDLIGDLLGLRLIFNPGAAFSLAAGSTWALTLVAVVVIVVIARSARTLTSRAWALTMGLLLAGALGNLTDRLLRPPGVGRGHVVDFIDYGWFIGNVADIWIVAALPLMIVLSLRGVPLSVQPTEQRPDRDGVESTRRPSDV